ncbi:hypothetical protein EDB84DRAFT_1636831 [Lactarius hengduanensis]|nr:hypothetical protein EDB84DRAFT_1636831 [Lactarius hengduanensis]
MAVPSTVRLYGPVWTVRYGYERNRHHPAWERIGNAHFMHICCQPRPRQFRQHCGDDNDNSDNGSDNGDNGDNDGDNGDNDRDNGDDKRRKWLRQRRVGDNGESVTTASRRQWRVGDNGKSATTASWRQRQVGDNGKSATMAATTATVVTR